MGGRRPEDHSRDGRSGVAGRPGERSGRPFASERVLLSTPPPWKAASWLFSVKFGAAGPRKQSYRLETGDTSGPSAVAVGYGKVWVLTCGNCNIGHDNQKLLEFDPDW